MTNREILTIFRWTHQVILDLYPYADISYLSICGGLKAFSQSTLIWVGGERRPQTQRGHIRTLPSKLLPQLGGSEPQEAISAWQGRQNQRQSGEETSTHTNSRNHTRITTEPVASSPDGSGEQHWPHTGKTAQLWGWRCTYRRVLLEWEKRN